MDTREEDLIVSWMKLDDQMHGHRKFVKLGTVRMAATGLWATAGSWASAAMTDGFVPDYIVMQWDPGLELAKALVVVGLWDPDTVDGEDGYRFHDWTEINGTREDILKARADAAERQRRSRDKRRRGDGTLGPDDPGGGGSQQALDIVTRDTNVTPLSRSRDVTRDGSVTNASITPAHPTPPHPTQRSTTTSSGTAGRDRAAKPNPADPPGFREWYVAYPRHEAVGDARKAYTAARKKIDADTLLAGAHRYRAQVMRERREPRHVALPASWLRGERWLDETPRTLRSTGLNDY